MKSFIKVPTKLITSASPKAVKLYQIMRMNAYEAINGEITSDYTIFETSTELMNLMRVSNSTFTKLIKELEKAGFLKVRRSARRRNVYTIAMLHPFTKENNVAG